MVDLREYQGGAVERLFDYWGQGGGNPLVVMATGTGKSVVIGTSVKELLTYYPTMRVLALVHVKELVEQNAKALLRLWPDAPIGINSAGLGQRKWHSQILFASVQSVYRAARRMGPRDLVLIDEAHLVPADGDGMYRRLLTDLREMTPDLRVAGFTATPFRMGSGRLDSGDGRLFDEVIFDYDVGAAVRDGYLAPLVSKATVTSIDVSDVQRRGGEFVESSLQEATSRPDITAAAVREIIEFGAERRSWLVFCAGVEHAQSVRDEMRRSGITCETVTGDTPAQERDRIIREFRAGRIRCLTNANVLTVGFDAPGVDLIAMLRATLSTGLYVQICGRGTRPIEPPPAELATADERRAFIASSSKPNCLVLDFVGNVRRHGPVDDIVVGPGRKAAAGEREGAVKVDSIQAKACPECSTLWPLRTMLCEHCGHEWPKPKPMHEAKADAEAVIMALLEKRPERWLDVDGVSFYRHQNRYDETKPPTMRVTYRCGFTSYDEYICFEHPPMNYARERAERWWLRHSAAPIPETVEEAVARTEAGEVAWPVRIVVKPRGNFHDVIRREITPEALERARSVASLPPVENEKADWWRVLSVSPDAEAEEIGRAFRTLAQQHHPDRGGSNAAMANINRAYQEAKACRA
ncbi:DEAD/DEAH box helicase family protein [Chelatococcus reniformis]|uniref:DNA helicase n=1 Tax=Chelatococcus reniformis TaxID=1494448 RepID=A0A916UDJ4_9HYPH|nr:DEAD/DEAH box helicase family protein [Chelatococcus reniformis]GGC68419.1 hypothetical protein GCM10010994_28740 [Chelatococcus reniformis]